MAWTSPADRTTGDVITAAQWNALLGTTGSLAQTAAAKVTTNGDVTYATAANTLARLGIGSSGQVLSVSGGIPAWATVSSSPVELAGSSTANTSTTSTSAVDLVTISGLSILVAQGIRLTHNFRKDASAANRVEFGLKINSTVVLEADATGPNSSATLQAEDGIAIYDITPRSSASYLTGLMCNWVNHVTATGAAATTVNGPALAIAAPLPNATITAMAVRARNQTTSNNAAVFSIRILTGAN